MEKLEKTDTRITLRDIFFYVLREWRLCAVLILCCAILFGAFRALHLISMIRSVNYQNQAQELYNQAVEFRKSETERLDREIKNQERWLQNRKEYIDESPLMAMEPNNTWISSVDMYFSGDVSNDGYFLLAIYQSALQNGRISQKLSEQMNIKQPYLQELIRVAYTNYYQTPLVSADKEETVWATNKALMHIAIIAGDEETAQAIMDMIIAFLEDLNRQMNTEAGLYAHHELAFLNYTCVNRRVDELDAYQKGVLNEAENVSKYLESLKKEKDELETPVYELMPLNELLLSSLKYALLGTFLGAILSLIVMVISCLYSDKIMSPGELQSRTGVRVFVLSEGRGHRFCGWIDRIINSSELKGELISPETAKRLLELDGGASHYIVWGERSEELLASIIPDMGSVSITDVEKMDSWRSLNPSENDGSSGLTRYILFANRKKTTYKELERKLEVIERVDGKNVICVLYV